MAEDVKGADVVPIKRGRGRPKGSGKKGSPALTVHNGGGGTSTETSRAALETAPGLGHNGADESLFLSWVRKIRTGQSAVAEAQALVKTAKGQLKDIRTQAKGEGIVLRELDMALEELDLERVDLEARYERERLYRTFLGLPADGKQAPTFSADEAGVWFHRGDIAGRLGEDRTVPEGCPGERVQDWLKGWEHGQEALMRTSPLTAAGFKKPGEHAGPPASEPQSEGQVEPTGRAPGGILVLKPEHFATDTDLEDASRATLLRDHLEAWTQAERVVALFDGKRRILKEPGFEDTGEADSETSDAEPIPSDDNPLEGIVDGDAEVEADEADAAAEEAQEPAETVVVGDPDGQVEETPPVAEPVADAEVEDLEPWNAGREVIDGPAPAGVVYYLAEEGPHASGRRNTYKDGAAFSTSDPNKAAGKKTAIYREHAPKVAGSADADAEARIAADKAEGQGGDVDAEAMA